MSARALRLACALLAGCGLTGCVAALPIVAGTVMTRQAAKGDAAEVDGPADAEAATAPVAAPAPDPAPPPSPVNTTAAPANRTEDIMAAALFAIDSIDNGRSVVPDPAATDDAVAVLPCNGARPALLVDLDPGEAAFLPKPAVPQAQPGLAAALAAARDAGLAVLWTGVLDESRTAEVRTALIASGLDPDGRDTLLLTRDPAESKTERRKAAIGEYCIKAIVGDRKGDFDTLFDYLRDPDAATPFDPLIGAGWFLLPPPLAYAA